LKNLFVRAGCITIFRSFRPVKSCIFVAAAFGSFVLSSAYAYAVSDHVRQACRDDYYQHCSQFSIGTDELRQCMRSVGEGLSAPCLVALVREGEISKADVERHNAAKGGKNAAKNMADNVGAKTVDDPKDVSRKSAMKKKIAGTANATEPGKAMRASKNAPAGSKATSKKKTTKAKKTASASTNSRNTSKAGSANKNKKAAKKSTSAKLGPAKPSSTKK
jgi:hypothetical protein